MAGIGPATSPLPRECSTTEPHGPNHERLNQLAQKVVERETGIGPASLAWKAKVLPLNYSRTEEIVTLSMKKTVRLDPYSRITTRASTFTTISLVEETGFEPV